MTWTTPTKLAKEWGVDYGQILRWIKSGDLIAHDLRRSTSTRPQWKISSESIEAFLAVRRSQAPPPKPARRRKPVRDKGWVDFV